MPPTSENEMVGRSISHGAAHVRRFRRLPNASVDDFFVISRADAQHLVETGIGQVGVERDRAPVQADRALCLTQLEGDACAQHLFPGRLARCGLYVVQHGECVVRLVLPRQCRAIHR